MEREITTIDVFIARHGIHLGERMRAPVDSALLFSKNPEIAGFNLPRIIARGVVSISARDKSRVYNTARNAAKTQPYPSSGLIKAERSPMDVSIDCDSSSYLKYVQPVAFWSLFPVLGN